MSLACQPFPTGHFQEQGAGCPHYRRQLDHGERLLSPQPHAQQHLVQSDFLVDFGQVLFVLFIVSHIL